MAKKPSKPKDFNSLEEDFLKIMEEGEDPSTVFESTPKPEKNPQQKDSFPKEKSLSSPQVDPKIASETFKDFGLVLTVSNDNMVAHLNGEKAHSFTKDTIEKGLTKSGVIAGIITDSIMQITSILKDKGSWTGKIMVARGVAPTEEEKLSFPFISSERKDAPEDEWIVDGKNLSFHGLSDLLNKKNIPGENEISRIKVRPVKEGETVAIIKAQQDPAPGFDIYGNTVPTGNPVLKPGDKLTRNRETKTYEASTFGYLCIRGNEVSILSPVMLSPDHMTAYFINCPHQNGKKEPSVTNIEDALAEKGVADKRMAPSLLEMLCTGLQQNKIKRPLVKIASGLEPIDGEDALFNLDIDLEVKAGAVLKNDSIDLKERNVIHSVAEGELLATKYFALPGKPGFTLINKKIDQKPGEDIKVNINGPIEQKRYEDRVEYIAEVAGNISCRKNTLTLSEAYQVNGNVDYATGNIDVKTGLRVTDSVMPGFKISAGGNTIIGGTVENGAQVLVRGDLNVGKGIIGKDTKVIVMGSLQAEFVQDAEIMVKGDVNIRSYSFSGNIRSGGQITVIGSAAQGGGKVVGGLVCATKGITISNFGSGANQNTLAAIQRDIESLSVLKKIQTETQNCTGTIMKIMKSLQLETVDMKLIRNLLERAPADKKEMIIKVVNNLNQLMKVRQELSQKEKDLEEKMEVQLGKTKIRVQNNAYLGNKIRFGDRQLTLDQDLGPTVFKLEDDKVVF